MTNEEFEQNLYDNVAFRVWTANYGDLAHEILAYDAAIDTFFEHFSAFVEDQEDTPSGAYLDAYYITIQKVFDFLHAKNYNNCHDILSVVLRDVLWPSKDRLDAMRMQLVDDIATIELEQSEEKFDD